MIGETYRISDLVLASGVRLPELERVTGAPDWVFTLTRGVAQAPPSPWFRHWRNGRQRVASFARMPTGYLVRFHGFADFAVDENARTIVGRALKSAAAPTIRHLLLDQVMPLAISRGHRLVLHAAAVSTPAGAVAFVGPTGAGKSTMAAALAVGGLPLMTDDCLVVERTGNEAIARPFYPGARLWPDSLSRMNGRARSAAVAHYTRKRRVAHPRVPCCADPMPLASVFVLKAPVAGSRRRPVSAAELSPRQAMLELLACTFHLDTEDAASARAAFEIQSYVVESVPVRYLTYPWHLAKLRETCVAVKQILDRGTLA